MTSHQSDSLFDPIELPPDKQLKVDAYRIRNRLAVKGQTVFAGSSLMEFFPILELQQASGKSFISYNRGVAGFVTRELAASLEECVLELEPTRLFINIGSNDMNEPDYTPEALIGRYEMILNRIKERLPDCRIFTMAYYPVNAEAEFPGVDPAGAKEFFSKRNNETIADANAAVEEMAKRLGVAYIDVNDGLTDERGNLNADYCWDGIHMFANGYKIVWDHLQRYL
ncbi:hypothetical protein B9G55_08110 [Saccharibacillus sp. O16]|nr:hypothetical protein B9G55_08110 [Saccharibacillus sp. O16]